MFGYRRAYRGCNGPGEEDGRAAEEGGRFCTGTSNLDLATGGKLFAVLSMPEPAPGERGSLNLTMTILLSAASGPWALP